MSFTMETEQNKKMSFLCVCIIRDQGNLKINVYQKPIFSVVYTHFDIFYTTP